ncbi:MAG: dipeptidase PepE [Bacteroidales bacterium]|nr:dipeptidase PepE [Bacteroidales bacterium]
MRLLLFSNSTNAGEEYLAYTLPYIEDFLRDTGKEALFIPYAGISVGYERYSRMVASQLSSIGINLTSIHQAGNKAKAIKNASVIIIGGGNTFYLLNLLQNEKLMEPIRKEVLEGKAFIGWSAGSNMACPTICTTNDMPIVEPLSFQSLGFLPFQINPHYTDFVQQGHAGETRDMRLREYILANPGTYVVGLREGSLLQVEGNQLMLKGNKPCKIFRHMQDAFEISPGGDLNFLMG